MSIACCLKHSVIVNAYVMLVLEYEEFEDAKGASTTVYQRTDNTMAKTTNNDRQNIHIKLKIE